VAPLTLERTSMGVYMQNTQQVSSQPAILTAAQVTQILGLNGKILIFSKVSSMYVVPLLDGLRDKDTKRLSRKRKEPSQYCASCICH